MNIPEMPIQVAAYFNRHFRGAKIRRAEFIKDSGGRTYFMLELHDQLVFHLKFDEEGNLVDKKVHIENRLDWDGPVRKSLPFGLKKHHKAKTPFPKDSD